MIVRVCHVKRPTSSVVMAGAVNVAVLPIVWLTSVTTLGVHNAKMVITSIMVSALLVAKQSMVALSA